jgi:hypothetical protein
MNLHIIFFLKVGVSYSRMPGNKPYWPTRNLRILKHIFVKYILINTRKIARSTHQSLSTSSKQLLRSRAFVYNASCCASSFVCNVSCCARALLFTMSAVVHALLFTITLCSCSKVYFSAFYFRRFVGLGLGGNGDQGVSVQFSPTEKLLYLYV